MMRKPISIIRKSLRVFLMTAGGLASLFLLWTILGLPIFIDRLCISSDEPIEADFIICVGAGFTRGNLPTDDGWERIYTAVQLYLDGYGRKIVFSGGGSGRVSEAEIYAEAAHWLGMAEGDALLDPGPSQTSEHPRHIRQVLRAGITNETPLNIVTSQLHSKRTKLCFKKAGFTRFSLVTAYRATGRRTAVREIPSGAPGMPPVKEDVVVSRPDAASFLRAEKRSSLPAFRKTDKVYDDLFIRLRQRSWNFFTTLRELAALAVYKVKGYV